MLIFLKLLFIEVKENGIGTTWLLYLVDSTGEGLEATKTCESSIQVRKFLIHMLRKVLSWWWGLGVCRFIGKVLRINHNSRGDLREKSHYFPRKLLLIRKVESIYGWGLDSQKISSFLFLKKSLKLLYFSTPAINMQYV